MKIKSKLKGFSLVEVIIAVFIFLLIVGGVLRVLLQGFYLMELSRQKNTAFTHLASMMEKIRSTSFADVKDDFPDGVIDGGANKPYGDIVGNYTLNNERITVNYVNPQSDPLEIMVEVEWEDTQQRTQRITASTFKTR